MLVFYALSLPLQKLIKMQKELYQHLLKQRRVTISYINAQETSFELFLKDHERTWNIIKEDNDSWDSKNYTLNRVGTSNTVQVTIFAKDVNVVHDKVCNS